MLYISCTGDSLVSTNPKTEDEILPAGLSIGELHNEFVKAFLAKQPILQTSRIDNDWGYLDLYIETACEVCNKLGVDFEPNKEILASIIEKNISMREAGVYDIFNPVIYSPLDVIDGIVKSGNISSEESRHLKSIFNKLQKMQPCDLKTDEAISQLTFLTAMEKEEASQLVLYTDDILVNSIKLWSEIYGESGEELLNIDPADSEMVAEWWKTLTKIFTTATADTLALAASTYCTWNPAAVGFVTAVASLAVMEAFNERGW